VICVGTPPSAEAPLLLDDVQLALDQVLERCRALRQLEPVIVLRSTVPVGTCSSRLVPRIRSFSARHPGFEPRFFYFPEFLREGSSLEDSRNPPLRILGGEAPHQGASRIESAFGMPAGRMTRTAFEVAEAVKLSSNAFHGLKIAFVNEVSSLCRILGVDGLEVMRLFNEDTKLNISSAYLRPGFAFGGPCLEKDLESLGRQAAGQGLSLPLVDSVLRSNEAHFNRALEMLRGLASDSDVVGFLGLGFKSGAMDTRCSPAARLMREYGRAYPARKVRYFSGALSVEAFGNAEADQSLAELVARSHVLVIGPAGLEPTDLELLANFRGLILDLMYQPEISEAICRGQSYHRIC
jgi:GDP-mannose 6-dehydrogenase